MDVLERYPGATLRELMQRVEQEHAVVVSASNMARMRQELHKV
jgi:hypothetical protein